MLKRVRIDFSVFSLHEPWSNDDKVMMFKRYKGEFALTPQLDSQTTKMVVRERRDLGTHSLLFRNHSRTLAVIGPHSEWDAL